MDEIIKLLQKRVYKLDFMIGNVASELTFGKSNTIFDYNKNLEYYNAYIKERETILKSIKDLSEY